MIVLVAKHLNKWRQLSSSISLTYYAWESTYIYLTPLIMSTNLNSIVIKIIITPPSFNHFLSTCRGSWSAVEHMKTHTLVKFAWCGKVKYSLFRITFHQEIGIINRYFGGLDKKERKTFLSWFACIVTSFISFDSTFPLTWEAFLSISFNHGSLPLSCI